MVKIPNRRGAGSSEAVSTYLTLSVKSGPIARAPQLYILTAVYTSVLMQLHFSTGPKLLFDITQKLYGLLIVNSSDAYALFPWLLAC